MSRCNTMQIGMVFALKQFGLSHGLVQKVMQDIGRPVNQGLISDTMLQWRNHELIGQLFRAEFNQLLELRSTNPNQYYKKVYARMANEGPEGVFIKNRRKYDPFAIRGTHKKNADSDSSTSSSSSSDSDQDNYQAMKRILKDYMKANNGQSENNSSESDNEINNSWITESEDEERDKNMDSDSNYDFEQPKNDKNDIEEDRESKKKQKKKLVVPSFLKNKQKDFENEEDMEIDSDQLDELQFEEQRYKSKKLKVQQQKQHDRKKYLDQLANGEITMPPQEDKRRGRKKKTIIESAGISEQQRDAANGFVQTKLKIMRAEPNQGGEIVKKGLMIVKPIKKPINIIRKPISKPNIVKKILTKIEP